MARPLQFTSTGYGAIRILRNLAVAGLVAASPAAAETVTLAALGDSLTQGYGLPQEQGFVPQLEGWLEEHGEDVDIVNAGVSGDTTAGGLSRVDWTLTPDVDGLIVALGGNDLLRGIDPSVSRGNLDGLLQVAQAKDVPTMLIGLTAPGNYGPDYKQAFDAMYPELAKTYGSVYVESFLAPLEEMDDRQGAMRDYMQADGIHPNAEGVKLIVEALGPRVQQLIGRIVD